MATACYAEAVADGNPMIGRASSTEYLPPRGAQLRAPSVPLRNRYVQRTPRQGAIPRRGLGAALTAHFQTMCAGSKLFTSTNMSNRVMQDLLIRAGFRPSGYIDNLDENDPEIVFYSPLKPIAS